jgi:flagellar biosynthetic protein FliQ
MNDGPILQIAGQTLYLATKLAGPVLAGALAIGLLVALLQTLTQIQEATLSFLPKLAVIALILK